MVNVFGQSTEKVGERGEAGPPGSNNLKELINWFPDLAIEQINKNVNFSTFLVETLPPNEDWDVKQSDDKRVIAWRSFNHHRDGKMIFTPVNQQTKGSVLRKVLPELSAHQRYGLKFESEEQNMYTLPKMKTFCLRDKGRNVVLTLTFLVGDLPEEKMKNTMLGTPTSLSVLAGEGEEFILNDYHLSEERTNIRGISIVSNYVREEFDLFLHGAVGGMSENRLKIAEGLKMSWFYTLQVKWGAEYTQSNGSSHISDSFYKIYENNKYLIEKSFKPSLIKGRGTPAFYLGGLKTNSSTNRYPMWTKRNCFTGILSNFEILKTDHDKIPRELLNFIVIKQSIFNDDWCILEPAKKIVKKDEKKERVIIS